MRQSHGHGIASASQAHRGRLAAVLAVTSSVLVVEVIGAILSDSLALLADAGHMLTGVAGIGVALLAIWFAARPATPERTFGYYRLEILAAVVNAVLLFGVAGFVLVEAWQRLRDPPEVASGLMLAMAAVGLATNGWLLRDAVDVLLEATPKGVDLAEMRRHLVETPGSWTCTTCTPGPSPAACRSCRSTSCWPRTPTAARCWIS